MRTLLQILLEGVMGYLLQTIALIMGIHAVAKQRMDVKKSIVAFIICTVVIFLIRSSDLFNFGVHTMLMLLVINAVCITLCGLNIRPSILGSILMVLFVLLSEFVNVGIMNIFYTSEQITVLLMDPITKAGWAIPGNIVLIVVAFVMYYLRTIRGERAKDGSGQ